ncbi:MAG: hypothetical protein ACR5KV_00720, partial [Wolbachia sp.]
MPEEKLNIFAQRVYDAYENKPREIYCIVTGLAGILCKISLQFCCKFIDNNRSNICAISDIAKLMKLPTSIIFILHLGLNLAGYK